MLRLENSVTYIFMTSFLAHHLETLIDPLRLVSKTVIRHSDAISTIKIPELTLQLNRQLYSGFMMTGVNCVPDF